MVADIATFEKVPAPRGRLRRGRILAGILLPPVALLAWGATYLRSPSPDALITIPVVVQGEPCALSVEHFMPRNNEAATKHPAIILLHGVEGADRYAGQRRRTADKLRDEGYAVFIVHYFDAVSYDDLFLLTSEGELDIQAITPFIASDAPRWSDAVAGAVAAIAQRADVDPERIALDGYSLGGFIALATAAKCQSDEELADVCAVVVNWGASFADTQFSPRCPPTLFIHGELDTTVPLDWTRETMTRLTASGVETDLHVVPGASHTAISADAHLRTLAFLAEQLPTAALHASTSSSP